MPMFCTNTAADAEIMRQGPELIALVANPAVQEVSINFACVLRVEHGDAQGAGAAATFLAAAPDCVLPSSPADGGSLNKVARCFGRDHSSIHHGITLIRRRCERDAAFKRFIEKLDARLTGPVPATATAA
jgi:hypothetical protein